MKVLLPVHPSTYLLITPKCMNHSCLLSVVAYLGPVSTVAICLWCDKKQNYKETARNSLYHYITFCSFKLYIFADCSSAACCFFPLVFRTCGFEQPNMKTGSISKVKCLFCKIQNSVNEPSGEKSRLWDQLKWVLLVYGRGERVPYVVPQFGHEVLP